MKNLKLLLCTIAIFAVCACTEDDDKTLGVWYRRSDFDGTARQDAAGFTIGKMGYLVGGYRGKTERLKDCWEYNTDNDWWTQCNSMPDEAVARNGAVGFAVGSNGYVTTGYTVYKDDGTSSTIGGEYLKDTWEYNPATNSWRKMDDYPAEGRVNAVAFTIGNYGYVGTGYIKDEKSTKDFYRFNPAAATGNQWEIVNGFGGQKRDGALAFVINNIAYVVGGRNNGQDVTDFWCFDPTLSDENKWVRLRDIKDSSDDDYDDDYTSIARTFACSFVIDHKAYITLGQTAGGSFRSNYWIYDPTTDLWQGDDDDYDLTTFEGSSRIKAVSFSTGTRGFVTAGGSSSTFYDDTYELKPYEYDED